MKSEFEKKYYEESDYNWWNRGRRECILGLLAKADKEAKILDIGCGGGNLLLSLKRSGFKNIYGIDNSPLALEKSQAKNSENISLQEADHTNFADNNFDFIISSDSLEHVKDDQKALQEWYRILKPHGNLLIFTPAFGWLWSIHDEINEHYRRYTKIKLIKKIKQVGFSIERSSYWMFWLFLLVCLDRLIIKKILKPGQKFEKIEKKEKSLADILLYPILKWENYLFVKLKFNYPFGSSVFILAKK